MAVVDTQKVWQALVIMLFAGAIVILGAKDLERHIKKQGGRNLGGKNLIDELHGNVDPRRASPARGWLPDFNLGFGSDKGSNKGSRRELGREDRDELKRLLEDLGSD